MMYRAVALCALVLLVVAPNYSQAQKADLNSNGSNPATNSAAASSPAINPGKPLAAEVAAKGNNVAAASPAQKPSVTPLTASNSAPGAAPNSAQPAALQTAAVKGQQQPGQHAAPALAAPAAKQDQQQQQTALAQQATLAVEPAPNAETLGLELDELMSTNAPIIIQSADDLTNAGEFHTCPLLHSAALMIPQTPVRNCRQLRAHSI